jgi:hypothetical protein
MQPRTLKNYIEQADDLAEDVVHAWGVNATSTPEFSALFELACEYRGARYTADDHRDSLSEQEAEKEQMTREWFALGYKHYWEEYALVF